MLESLPRCADHPHVMDMIVAAHGSVKVGVDIILSMYVPCVMIVCRSVSWTYSRTSLNMLLMDLVLIISMMQGLVLMEGLQGKI